MSELEFDFYSALESQASTEECKTKLKNITSLKDKERFTKNVVLIEEHDITAKVLRLIKFKIDRCVFDQLDDNVKIGTFMYRMKEAGVTLDFDTFKYIFLDKKINFFEDIIDIVDGHKEEVFLILMENECYKRYAVKMLLHFHSIHKLEITPGIAKKVVGKKNFKKFIKAYPDITLQDAKNIVDAGYEGDVYVDNKLFKDSKYKSIKPWSLELQFYKELIPIDEVDVFESVKLFEIYMGSGNFHKRKLEDAIKIYKRSIFKIRAKTFKILSVYNGGLSFFIDHIQDPDFNYIPFNHKNDDEILRLAKMCKCNQQLVVDTLLKFNYFDVIKRYTE